MSNEVRINNSLQIKVGSINHSSRPTAFTDDLSDTKGPTPGAITVALVGTDVDFSELTTPGYCRIANLEAKGDSSYVEYGVWDPEGARFYPLGEILPGQFYTIRFSRWLQEEFGSGSGTGTAGADTNRFRLKAHGAASDVLVEAFEA